MLCTLAIYVLLHITEMELYDLLSIAGEGRDRADVFPCLSYNLDIGQGDVIVIILSDVMLCVFFRFFI